MPGKQKKVGILIYDDVEVLDFCGPFEVFSVAGFAEGEKPFEVITIAEKKAPVAARNGLSVNPDAGFADTPRLDILLVPGGPGSRKEMHNEALLGWVRRTAGKCELLLSVCTGALILGRAGLIDGMESTTHRGALELLRTSAPETRVDDQARFVDNGTVILSAGISAGIDMSLYAVGRLCGAEIARSTARYMEYDYSPSRPRPELTLTQ